MGACRVYEADALAMWFSLGNTEFPGGSTPITSQEVAPAEDVRDEYARWRRATSGGADSERGAKEEED